MPRCSIIIPTYNNEPIIAGTLSALSQQAVPAPWQIEVIISDDGSRDATVETVRSQASPAAWRVQVLTGAHVGPAQVRNRALAAATGEVILLLQADIELRPGALAAHLLFHQENPGAAMAALGFVVWDPRLPPSRLMVWMMHGGHHNDFDALLGEKTADPQHFFYGAQVSLKREMLAAHQFSTAFTGYGWEDLELGRRLKEAGLQLSFLPDARALHVHYYGVKDVCRRQFNAGKSLHVYHRLHPTGALAPLASRRRWFKYRVVHSLGIPVGLQWLVAWSQRYWVTPRLFSWLTAVYFWEGWYSEKL